MSGNAGGSRNGRVTLFCAMGRSVGRTTTLVRVALCLRDLGHRVLVVDASPAENRVGDHLSGGEALELVTVDGLPELREILRPADPLASPLADHDHVLVDAPVVGTEAELEAFAEIADTAVVCFALNPWSPDGAARFTRALARGAMAATDLLAVGHHTEPGGQSAIRTVRDKLQAVIGDPAVSARLEYLEIPHAPEYRAAGPGAVDAARGAAQHVLDAHYARLAGRLDGDGRRGIERAEIRYARRHAAWASWIDGLLTARGVETATAPLEEFTGAPPPPGTALLVVSPGGMTEHAAAPMADLPNSPDLRLVLVDGLVPPRTLEHHERVDLSGLAEPAATALLLEALRLGDPGRAVQGGASPFPRLPAQTNLAPRNPAFVGRDRVIEELREELAHAAARGVACVLEGAAGMGKSEIALEYCHRYGGEYGAIWWVSAESELSIRGGLSELAGRLRLPVEEDALDDGRDGTVRAMLAELARSTGWLLVYDGVADGIPAEFLPEASDGRVLVTARSWAEERPERVVRVPPFSPVESTSLLLARLPLLSLSQAQRVGSTLGNVPLAVGLAASLLAVQVAWRRSRNATEEAAAAVSVDALCANFTRRKEELLAEGGRTASPQIMLEVVRQEMRRDKEIAVWGGELGGVDALDWILEVCALLAETGVTIGFLKSEGMQAALMRDKRRRPRREAAPEGRGAEPEDDSPLLPTDPLMIDAAVWCLARYGLLEIDLDRVRQPLRQHATLRRLLRESMPRGRRAALERDVRGALAAYRPSGEAAREPSAEVYRHLAAIELWETSDSGVRRAVVQRVYDLVQAGDRSSLEIARYIGRRAEASWRARDAERGNGTRRSADDRPPAEYLRLLNLLAQSSRSLGDYRGARGYAFRALRGQQLHYGLNHPRTLLTADAYGSILRALGEFGDARLECGRVAERLAEILGPDHYATVQAEHNLALCELLVGNARAALTLAQYRFDRGLAIGGESEETAWVFVPTLAEYHRALGQVDQSLRLLKDYLGHRARSSGEEEGVDLDLLRVEGGLAVSERRKGRVLAAHDRDSRLLELCRGHLGERSLDTLTRRLSLAADLCLLDKHEEALQEAGRCADLLERTMGADHPFTQLPRIQQSIALRRVNRPREALALGEEALALFERRLEHPHPWSAGAAVSLANTLVGLGELDRAAALERAAIQTFEDLREPAHPDRRIAEGNLADTLARLRGPDGRGSRLPRRDLDWEIPGI